jgi:hypothetical protein
MPKTLADLDPELYAAIAREARRQSDNLELIASENYTSEAVMEAQGSLLTNKYAEGYPGKRYYGGCEHVDVVESLAIERAKKLFGAEHANVQPHSGTQANISMYLSVLEPGDTVMGLNLAHGGHLSHGHPKNFSGRLYEVHAYGVDETTRQIDYDALEARARDVRPKVVVAGASAYPRIFDFERMAAIAHGVGALLFVDMAHIAGLVAAGVHPVRSPMRTSSPRPQDSSRSRRVFPRADLPDAVDRALPDGKTPGPGRQERLPVRQGGPEHVIAGKPSPSTRGDRDFRRTRPGRSRTRRLARPSPRGPGWCRWHGHHLRWSTSPPGAPAGAERPRRGRDHCQQERYPVRPTRTSPRGSGRHPGDDDARHGRTDAAIGRLVVRSGAGGCRWPRSGSGPASRKPDAFPGRVGAARRRSPCC